MAGVEGRLFGAIETRMDRRVLEEIVTTTKVLGTSWVWAFER